MMLTSRDLIQRWTRPTELPPQVGYVKKRVTLNTFLIKQSTHYENQKQYNQKCMENYSCHSFLTSIDMMTG